MLSHCDGTVGTQLSTPSGIRTRATGVKGRRPRPLDDGGAGGEYRCPVHEIRRFADDDFDQVFELLDTRSRAVLGSSEEERGYLRRRLDVPGTDSFVALGAGRIAGHAALGEDQEIAVCAADARSSDALFETVEARARERGFDHLALTAAPEDEALCSLARRTGFVLDREIWRMWRTLDGELAEPRWADGATVRTYTDDDGEQVHALLDAAYAGWDRDYVARGHEGWLAFMTQHDEFDPALWFLVERDGALVGCSLHWAAHQNRGWVKDIVVAEGERGRGLGRALLQHAFRAYAERGVERVGLKVDSSNPTGARQLYECVGFVTDRRYEIWTKTL